MDSATETLNDHSCKVSHSCSLEQFICDWEDDPVEFSHFVGYAVGRIGYRHLPDLFFCIGTSYFALQKIPERIDFLYDHQGKKLGGEKGRLISQMVSVSLQDGTVCLHDKSGRHGRIRAMLLRDVVDDCPYFSVRYFIRISERITEYLKKHWDQKQRGKPTFKAVAAQIDDDLTCYGLACEFWNFRVPEEPLRGVTVYPDSQGFFDLMETKSIADLIILASNGAGFRC